VTGFEKLLEKGPLTLVLVYADWCGACHRFKENTWNNVTRMKDRTMNIGSVREDMLPETSLANAKISHYPSLLLVGSDKRPAEFTSPEGQSTNALPNNETKNIQQLLKTPVEEVPAVSQAKNVSVSPVEQAVNLSTEPASMEEESTPMSSLEAQNTLPTPQAMPANAVPPNMNLDLKTSIQNASAAAASAPPKPIVGGGRINAGSLYSALTTVVKEGLPAGLLVAGTQVFGKKKQGALKRRRTRKVRGQKRNKFGRFSRRR
jgi:hypothetical protein